jgi:hypothetical protein
MDNEFLKQALGELSDEDIQTLLAEFGGGKPDEKPVEKAAPVVDENRLADSVADKLVQKANKEPRQAPAPEPVEFDQDQYAKLLVKDARKAQQYLEQATYGVAVGQLVPALVAGMAGLVSKVQELERGSFNSQVPEYANPETRAVIEAVMAENGWEPSSRNLQNAVAIARGTGRLEASEEPARRSGPPPRLPRAKGQEIPEMTEEAILDRAAKMSDEELENFLLRAGVIQGRHLT